MSMKIFIRNFAKENDHQASQLLNPDYFCYPVFMKISNTFFIAAILAFLLPLAFSKEVRRATFIHSTPEETALFLAGLPVAETSVLSALQQQPEYTAHAQAMQQAWSDYRQHQFDPMREWAQEELPTRIPESRVIRYPFGGPDILSLLALFPNAQTYILGGMEPIGKITPPEELTPEFLTANLAKLRETTKTDLGFGYFITKEMRANMAEGSFQGVLPVLATSLALAGYQIISIDKLHLKGIPGTCIRFHSLGEPEKKLYYIQADLSNEGSSSLLKWLASFGSGAAYLKAASYLMHEAYFSRIRQFLLRNSDAILEDDSGIPFRYFSSDWTLYLFGNYKGPIELFRPKYQADLYEAYQSSPLTGPMPFGTGYQFQPGLLGGANLLLAVKKSFIPKAVPVR